MINYTRNDCKISFKTDQQQFFINEESGVVICKLNGTLIGPEADFWDALSFNSVRLQAVGKAKCSPDDTFDVNVGKKIALAKAENAMYVKAGNLLYKRINEVDNFANMLVTFFPKADKVIKHNLEYIERLTKVEK